MIRKSRLFFFNPGTMNEIHNTDVLQIEQELENLSIKSVSEFPFSCGEIKKNSKTFSEKSTYEKEEFEKEN